MIGFRSDSVARMSVDLFTTFKPSRVNCTRNPPPCVGSSSRATSCFFTSRSTCFVMAPEEINNAVNRSVGRKAEGHKAAHLRAADAEAFLAHLVVGVIDHSSHAHHGHGEQEIAQFQVGPLADP